MSEYKNGMEQKHRVLPVSYLKIMEILDCNNKYRTFILCLEEFYPQPKV
jgi:hypothetical protein